MDGTARIYGNACIRYGHSLTKDIKDDFITYIAASLNVFPLKGKYYLYKRVNKIKDGIYVSLYDGTFIYKDGETAEVENPDMDFKLGCSTGLHVSTADYWPVGDTLIIVEVDINDIITCMEGKLRVRRLKVLEEVKI